MSRPLSPLVLYVAWHPEFAGGRFLSEQLYSRLQGPIDEPLKRGSGIPVFFRSASAPGSAVPADVPFGDTDHTVLVVLVDDNAVADDDWCAWTVRQWQGARSSPGQVFLPVALTPSAANLDVKLAMTNYIWLVGRNVEEAAPELVCAITHECARLLRGVSRASGALATSPRSPAPVRIFLSYSRRDGSKLAENLRDYIQTATLAKAFFDKTDIAYGHDFWDEIEAEVEDGAFVVIQTDQYGSREWCQAEVLAAKARGRPMVVVNAVATGEERLFPYIGNVPTIRWDPSGPSRAAETVELVLREVLRDTFFRRTVALLQGNGWLPSQTVVLPRAPELINCLSVARGSNGAAELGPIVYPDPPIATREMKLLLDLSAGVDAVTPTSAPFRSEAGASLSLEGRKIALSVGLSADLEPLGLGEAHVKNAALELARHLLSQGAKLAYGGDLRSGGFTQLLADLVESHNRTGREPFEAIIDYMAWPFHEELDAAKVANLKQMLKIIKVPPPVDIDAHANASFQADDPARWYAEARCLTAMRETMTRDVTARIVLGGKVVDFAGAYPGIVEEAILCIKAARPLFVLGGFGGGARVVAAALRGDAPPELTADYYRGDRCRVLTEQYNRAAGPCHEPIDYQHIMDLLAATGPRGLRNGLTLAENERLLDTRFVQEAVFLVLKGLARLAACGDAGTDAGA